MSWYLWVNNPKVGAGSTDIGIGYLFTQHSSKAFQHAKVSVWPLTDKAFFYLMIQQIRNQKTLFTYPGQSCCYSGCDIFSKLFTRSNFCCPNLIKVLCVVVDVCQLSSLNQSGALLNTCTPTRTSHVNADLDADDWFFFFCPSLFLQVVLSCTLAHAAVPARVLAALQVDTRPSRPPPTRSLHPQRVSPFRRLGPWSREGNKGEELLPRGWSSSFLK